MHEEELKQIVEAVFERLRPFLKNQVKEADVVMDIQELAEYLSITVRHVRLAVQKRSLPYFKVGSRVRFRKKDIDNHVNRRAVAPSRFC